MAEVFNDDITGIYRRVNRFIVELQKSQSSNVADINPFDIERITKYLDALDTYVNWVVSQPALDLPETHPKTINLENPPAIIETENLMVRDLVRLFERARDEVINSQSARNATGLISFDLNRLRAVIAKSRKYISEYVQEVTPIDLPESSPMNEDSGSGLTGINP